MKMSDWVSKQLPADERALRRLNLEFDINLAEERLRKNPKDVQAVSSLGIKYTEVGQFEKALDMDLRLVTLTPEDPTAFYNLACSHALLHDKDAGLKALALAIDKGYRDLQWLTQDEDLQFLRSDPRFQTEVDRLRNLLDSEA